MKVETPRKTANKEMQNKQKQVDKWKKGNIKRKKGREDILDQTFIPRIEVHLRAQSNRLFCNI